jgi:hypothetical protein
MIQRGRRLLPGGSLRLADLAKVVTLCEANRSSVLLRLSWHIANDLHAIVLIVLAACTSGLRTPS